MLVGQKTGSNKIDFIYDSNGDYYGFEYNDVPYNYIKNLQGDVVAIADGAGNILVQYYYDAWGRILEIDDDSTNSIGTINPIRYRGYYFDSETGFYYLQSRYYDTITCRFLNADAYVSTGAGFTGFNMFAYCNNNSVLYTDSFGDRPFVGTSTENETAEVRFLSFATMNNTSVESISTDFSGTIYVVNTNTRDNTKSASTKALINNSGNGYWVILDNRNNGAVEIINSYKTYNIANQADILNTFFKYTQNNPKSTSNWYRTISSMYVEWTWHNLFYYFGFMRENAKSACFDMYQYCNTDNMLLQIYGEIMKRYRS